MLSDEQEVEAAFRGFRETERVDEFNRFAVLVQPHLERHLRGHFSVNDNDIGDVIQNTLLKLFV